MAEGTPPDCGLHTTIKCNGLKGKASVSDIVHTIGNATDQKESRLQMYSTLDKSFLLGLSAHNKAMLHEAETCCRAALPAEPNHADAHHKLVALAIGKPPEALPLLKKALATKQVTGQLWLSYIEAPLKAKWFVEVIQALAAEEHNEAPLNSLSGIQAQL